MLTTQATRLTCIAALVLTLAACGEPTRVFRRQFILSHATLADSSNWR